MVKPSNRPPQQAYSRASLQAPLNANQPHDQQAGAADLDRKMTLFTEDLVSLTQVAQELDVHVSAPYRWLHRGVRGVRLESVRIGGKLLTSRQAVNRFLRATQD